MLKTITYTYFLLISYLFLKPTGNTPPLFWGFDKLIHIVFFALLTLLIKKTFKNEFTNLFWITLMIFYAVIVEVLQHFMQLGRSFSIFDILADIIGIYLVIKLTNFAKPR